MKIAVFIVLLVGLSWFTLTSPGPWLAQRPAPNADEVRAGRETLERLQLVHGASGAPIPLTLAGEHLDGVAAMANQVIAPTRVAAGVESGTISLEASHPLPMGRWLNVVATAGGESNGFPAVRLTVGLWKLPLGLSRFIIDAGWRVLRYRGVMLPPLDDMVRRTKVDGTEVSALISLPDNSGLVEQIASVRETSVDAAAVARLYCAMAAAQRRQPEPDFTAQVRRLFALPEPALSPAEHNRAAFVALAMFAVDEQAGDLAGTARKDTQSCRIEPPRLMIEGRPDLPKHWSLSAALSAGLGTQVATAMGEWKELADSLPHGSGFSFVDLAADRGGFHAAQAGVDPERAVRFAAAMATAEPKQIIPPSLLRGVEGLTKKQFEAGYRSIDSPEFGLAAAKIDKVLGSGLIDHNQKMTVAAIAMADMKVWAQRSYRV